MRLLRAGSPFTWHVGQLGTTDSNQWLRRPRGKNHWMWLFLLKCQVIDVRSSVCWHSSDNSPGYSVEGTESHYFDKSTGRPYRQHHARCSGTEDYGGPSACGGQTSILFYEMSNQMTAKSRDSRGLRVRDPQTSVYPPKERPPPWLLERSTEETSTHIVLSRP